MTLSRPLFSKPSTTPQLLITSSSKPNALSHFNPRSLNFIVSMAAASSRPTISSAPHQPSTSPLIASSDSAASQKSPNRGEAIEADLEKVIYACRFMTFMAVLGSLIGSLLC